MSRRPPSSLFLVTVASCAFVAGIVADRAWVGRSGKPLAASSPNLRDDSNVAGKSGATSARASIPAPQASGVAPTKTLAVLPQEQQPAVRIQVTPPKNDQPVLEPEKEAQLADLMQAPLPAMKDPERQSNADGSVDVYGTAEDGRELYRHFNPKGELTREGWTGATGESFYRGFYESGGLKQVSWNRADRSSSTVSLTQSGLYESRYDQLPDGSTVATVYDDSGQVQEVAHESAEGAAEGSPAS